MGMVYDLPCLTPGLPRPGGFCGTSGGTIGRSWAE